MSNAPRTEGSDVAGQASLDAPQGGESRAEVGLALRIRVFVQRLLQPTSACMFCMTAPTFANLISASHWKIALQTGIGTALLAVLLTFTPLRSWFTHRYRNALLMGLLTALADAWSHPGRGQFTYGEAILTGIVSGLLTLAASYVFEDGARRLRKGWAKLRGGTGAR